MDSSSPIMLGPHAIQLHRPLLPIPIHMSRPHLGGLEAQSGSSLTADTDSRIRLKPDGAYGMVLIIRAATERQRLAEPGLSGRARARKKSKQLNMPVAG